MTLVNLSPSPGPFLFTKGSVGDILQIPKYLNRQDDVPDEDDLLSSDIRKFKDLRSLQNEKFKKEEIFSVDNYDLSHVA